MPYRRSLLMLLLTGWLTMLATAAPAFADLPKAFPNSVPNDSRLSELRNLNGYHPFRPIANLSQWEQRQQQIKRRILVSQGLWPLPTRTPLNAVVHGQVERDDFTVDRVYFESIPGHFVTGSLYRPREIDGPLPVILSPHGHWRNGRFYEADDATIKRQIETGAETFADSGRYPIQARAVHLARMGCQVFVYDMIGYADSVQIGHRPDKWSHLDRQQDWGFMSTQAELRLQNMMGLQTWNSIRAVDFVLQLPETDPTRVGVTGASGGGTQSMILAAIDSRITAAMPCVMVSTSMQGGCTCENAPLLRIGQGNVDIAAATAPRPLGLTAADDWTVELQSKGFPDLQNVYQMVGHPDHLTAVFHTQFPHNYNQVNRRAMYEFFHRHFRLSGEQPLSERDFTPLTVDEATVWNESHPAPSGDQVGDSHEIALLQMATADSERQMRDALPTSREGLDDFQRVYGGGWETIIGRRFAEVGEVGFDSTASVNDSDASGRTVHLRVGQMSHESASEHLPALVIEPVGQATGTVVWITDQGKAGVMDDGQLKERIKALLSANYRIVAADLIGQGEFRSEDDTTEAQPMWFQRDGSQGWHRFAGYTYGYNHSRFVQRVHDVLTLVKYASSTTQQPVHLVGLGQVGGTVAVAAASQAPAAVSNLVVDNQGFRFVDLRRQDHPMFASGAVKYEDVDGLLSLLAPRSVLWIGSEPMPITEQLYRVRRAEESFRQSDRLPQGDRLVEFLTP